MIYTEDTSIKLGGALLPGLVKRLEIQGSALIEEVEVQGSAVKPKQGTGYEDAKITVDLIVDATPDETALHKIERIKAIFRRDGQGKPQPLPIVSPETTAAGVTRVLFKAMTATRTNKTDQYDVALELWEYIPMVITATSSTSGTATGAGTGVQLQQNYLDYLAGSRGTAPKLTDKTSYSPAFLQLPTPPRITPKLGGDFIGPLLP